MNLKKLERYLRVNLLGPGPRLIENNLPGRGLTKVEKHCVRRFLKLLLLYITPDMVLFEFSVGN
jgi:hypothetical protein